MVAVSNVCLVPEWKHPETLLFLSIGCHRMCTMIGLKNKGLWSQFKKAVLKGCLHQYRDHTASAYVYVFTERKQSVLLFRFVSVNIIRAPQAHSAIWHKKKR